MEEKKKERLIDRLRNRLRLVILNDDTFEEKFSLKLTGLNLFFVAGFSGFFLVLITFIFIAFTPLREYVPGYSTPGLRSAAIELAIKVDSLQGVINNQKVFLTNIQNIIQGKDPLELVNQSYGDSVNMEQIHFETSDEDSLFRLNVEQEQRYNLFKEGSSEEIDFSKLAFFTPLKGIITDKFDLQKKHFGVDIVSGKNEAVKAILSGTVVLSAWTSETGHVVAIQHQGGFYSTYKHNSILLKKEGASVKAGEVISIVGDSGELTTGPHLHFELWYNGVPVDPEKFILF